MDDNLITASAENSVVGEDLLVEETDAVATSQQLAEPGDDNVSEGLSTPFKLEQSLTENEEEEEEEDLATSDDLNSSGELRGNNGTPAATTQLQSPVDDDIMTESGESSARLKRKRYEIRRSGSEECLLGFDEQSGEAELVRGTKRASEKLHGNSEETSGGKTNFEGKVGRHSPHPPAAKKLKQGSPNSSPARASPKHLLPMKTLTKSADNSPKDHVVATDDPNGTIAAAVPKAKTPQHKMEVMSPVPARSPASARQRQTGGLADKKTVPVYAQDEFYRKPFDYGWKRELVWRANMETSKDKADVYFISPSGKKLRTRNDILPLLEGDLSIEHFNFSREPLGVGPEFEIVRSAKPSSRTSVAAATLAAASPTVTMGKRISKPKGPKGASPPPEGWTPTRALKVNNAALLSSNKGHGLGHSSGGGGGSNVGGISHVSGASGSTSSSTPTVSRGSSSSQRGQSSSASRLSKQKRTSSSGGKTPNSTKRNRNNNIGNILGSSSSASTKDPQYGGGVIADKSLIESQEPCTIACARAKGEVPQLQCFNCVRLYHHQCVGDTNRTSKESFICKACQSSMAAPTKTLAVTAGSTVPPPPPPAKASPNPSTSSSHAKPAATVNKKLPQSIAVVKGKKYIMMTKPINKPTIKPINKRSAYGNDIASDLKLLNDSIRNKPSISQTDDEPAPSNSVVPSTAELSTKPFATNFFANASFAYDSLVCVLKYLKIHERPRAASVCKLWNVAAKDTSLWHTVRMKNSKVCNWLGFAAALRRGETKHLDLRKMLVASTRGDETWHDFSKHIGIVGSLEVVDLCRCSARVVESLFQSNKNLRVLNAIAINDDTINLEHIGNLEQLEELRLRTCEQGVLSGELQPLQLLSNLEHLSLTAIRCLGGKDLEVFGELTQLKSLELGECGDFDETFAGRVLPKLTSLQRLRLENGQETACCTLAILDAVGQLEHLHQLELVNFDIKPGFDERMSQCLNLRKLLIIPTYISQSATTNHIVLSAVQLVADTLQVFTWGVTVELLRVTALYVDQCDDTNKKMKHQFDESIPVLKPVPGALPGDDDDDGEEQVKTDLQSHQRTDDDANNSGKASDVPQIEILPLDKVESILAENLPNTKYTIVKVPYHATCKQQLVE